MTYGLALIALLAVLALPLVAEARRQPMTRSRQNEAPGDIADLESGATHFQWSGSENAPVAVCIHGLTTPSYVFAATRTALETAGYRVLTYDLYGRGFSARVSGAQTLDFFTRHLDALLEDQGVTGPLTLVGFSMGGAIATRYAAQNANRVQALILVAPAGLSPVYDTLKAHLETAPVLGDWNFRTFGGLALRRELSQDVQSATVIPDLRDRQIAETRMRGFLPAVLSSRRFALREDLQSDHEAIAASGMPVLAVWGDADPVIPLSAIGRLADVNRAAHHVQIPGAGHGLLQTHPKQVAEAIQSFLGPLKTQPEGREAPREWEDGRSR